MMEATDIFRILSYLLAILTAAVYSYQLLYLLLPLVLRKRDSVDAAPKRYAILIAARNEERVLPHLLDSIAAQNYPAECIRTFVVADNCTDLTAQAAQDHGATVFTRFNTHRVGKGYALNFLLEQIDRAEGLDQFDAFLVFDADNLLDANYIKQINTLCAAGYPAFCGYRNTKNYGSNWLSAGYSLWYIHESAHLNRSRMALGTTCAVSGTGFGFTRELLRETGGWNFFTLTEDIEFTAWCASRGICIGYCDDAVVYDEQPTSFRVSVRQRTRWIQGGLQVSLRYASRLLKGILVGGRTGWACFEAATLTVWGYGLGTLSFACSALSAGLSGGWQALARTLIVSLVGSYFSLLAMGALTLAMEWRQIRAETGQKLRSVLTFPLFLFTYIPIAATAIFRKFEWKPIEHTCAISHAQLLD